MKQYSYAVYVFLCIFLLSSLTAFSSDDGIKTSNFQKWLVRTTKHLDEKGTIVETKLGPVQIVTKGNGPPVIVLHGGFGGWDQGELVSSNINLHGFKAIIPSRPGYLSTPIFTNPLILEETTAAEQADLMLALIDALGIPKVSLIGFSAGSQVAYEFGLRHPERTMAVVLESIGASPSEDGFFYTVLGLVLSTQTEQIDYATYLLHLSLIDDFYSSALQVLPQDTTLTGSALRERNRYVLNHISQYDFLRRMLKATIPLSPRLLGTLNDFLGIEYWDNVFTPPVNYSIPTLIIEAINDNNGFYPTAQSVHAAIPNSQLISVRDSGHFIWLGPETNRWQKQLFEFLKAHSQ